MRVPAGGGNGPRASRRQPGTPPAGGATTAGAEGARVTAWAEDLDVARDEFLRRDRSYSPTARVAATQRLEFLRASVGRLDDVEIAAELARIAALSGNAHTRLYLLRNRGHWRRFPLRLWRFDDGWRVVAAQGEADALLGGRVTHIAGRPVDEVFTALRSLFAGNESWAHYMGSYTLTSPDALHAAKLAGADGGAEFRVETDGEVRARTVSPSLFERRESAEESWWYLSPARAVGAGWRRALAAAALPELLRGASVDYRFLRCDGDIVYVQFNRAADTPGAETVAAWGERLLLEIGQRPPRRLVFDLRFNTGGDLTRALPLVEAIAASPLGQARGGIVVLSGESTFSAGITPLVVLRGTSRAIVVGRAPGDGTDFWAEGGNVVLAELAPRPALCRRTAFLFGPCPRRRSPRAHRARPCRARRRPRHAGALDMGGLRGRPRCRRRGGARRAASVRCCRYRADPLSEGRAPPGIMRALRRPPPAPSPPP